MNNLYGYGLEVLASVIWGLTYCLDERVLSRLSVYKLYFLHCLCGVFVAGAVLLFQGNSPASLVTLNTSAVLEISYPLFVALFSVLLFKGQLQPSVAIGGVFIFIGSAIIVLAK